MQTFGNFNPSHFAGYETASTLQWLVYLGAILTLKFLRILTVNRFFLSQTASLDAWKATTLFCASSFFFF